MPDFFQMNLEQMLSELRLHESNTQALFNALEGDKAVADYRKRCQNSEPQYEVFCKSYIIALVKKYVSSPYDSEILLAAYGFLRGFDQINGLEKRRKEYVEAAFGRNKKVTDRNGKPVKSLYTKEQPIIQALAAQLTKEVYKQDKRSSLGLADEVFRELSMRFPDGLPDICPLPEPRFVNEPSECGGESPHKAYSAGDVLQAEGSNEKSDEAETGDQQKAAAYMRKPFNLPPQQPSKKASARNETPLRTDAIISNIKIAPGRFFGRTEELKKARDNFQNNSRVQIISGREGQGKSIFAFEYAKTFYNEYQILCWLNCKDDITILGSIVGFLDCAGVELQGYSPEEIRDTFLRFFEENSGWLIVFDCPALKTAEDQEALKRYFPQNPKGHILITTSDAPECWEAKRLSLGSFTKSEADAFLTDAVGEMQHGQTVSSLSYALVYDPVALEYAAAYIRGTSWAAPLMYFNSLAERGIPPAEPSGEERNAFEVYLANVDSLNAAFDILMGRLRTQMKFTGDILDTAVFQILLISSYLCYYDSLNLTFLSQTFPIFPAELITVCRDDELRMKLIRRLRDYTFFEIQDGNLVYNERARMAAYQYFADQMAESVETTAKAVEAALVSIEANQYANKERVLLHAAPHVMATMKELLKTLKSEEIEQRYPCIVGFLEDFYIKRYYRKET